MPGGGAELQVLQEVPAGKVKQTPRYVREMLILSDVSEQQQLLSLQGVFVAAFHKGFKHTG